MSSFHQLLVRLKPGQLPHRLHSLHAVDRSLGVGQGQWQGQGLGLLLEGQGKREQAHPRPIVQAGGISEIGQGEAHPQCHGHTCDLQVDGGMCILFCLKPSLCPPPHPRTGQGRPRSPKMVQSAEGGEGKEKRERIICGC